MNMLNKYRVLLVVLWIGALITLGVVAHYAEQDIQHQRTKEGRSSDPCSLRTKLGGCPDGNHTRDRSYSVEEFGKGEDAARN